MLPACCERSCRGKHFLPIRFPLAQYLDRASIAELGIEAGKPRLDDLWRIVESEKCRDVVRGTKPLLGILSMRMRPLDPAIDCARVFHTGNICRQFFADQRNELMNERRERTPYGKLVGLEVRSGQRNGHYMHFRPSSLQSIVQISKIERILCLALWGRKSLSKIPAAKSSEGTSRSTPQ